ncbi:MAG: hypothetical protein K6E20_01020 [Acholeplasmatales bacterium]|nr:hypothetical protein [Acholeplasmatales bacterium]
MLLQPDNYVKKRNSIYLFIISTLMGLGSVVIYFVLGIKGYFPYIHNHIYMIRKLYFVTSAANVLILFLGLFAYQRKYFLFIPCTIFYLFIHNYLAAVPTAILFFVLLATDRSQNKNTKLFTREKGSTVVEVGIRKKEYVKFYLSCILSVIYIIGSICFMIYIAVDNNFDNAKIEETTEFYENYDLTISISLITALELFFLGFIIIQIINLYATYKALKYRKVIMFETLVGMGFLSLTFFNTYAAGKVLSDQNVNDDYMRSNY